MVGMSNGASTDAGGFVPAGPPPPGYPPPGYYQPPSYQGYPPPGYPPPGYAPPSYPPPGYPPPGYAPPWYPQGPPPALKPGVIPLRPLGLSDIFNGAIAYVRMNPKATLGLTTAAAVVAQLIALVLGAPVVAALVVVLVCVGVKLSFAPTLIVLERLDIVSAVRRSFALVKNDFWRVFGIIALGQLVSGMIAGAVSVPFTFGGQ